MVDFKINGVVIKRPSDFKISRYKVSTLERIANADMVGDFIAKKFKFYFTYEAIAGWQLDVILDAIWEPETMFFTLTIPVEGPTGNEYEEYIVYPGEIPADLHRASPMGNWVWKNVNFNLIQK